MLYLAYPGPHTPWMPTFEFVGKSGASMFGDFMMMIDAEIGRVMAALKAAGIRAEVDASDDRMQKKVRNAQMQKIPYMLIAGEEDQKAGAVSFRYRNGEQKNGVPLAEAIAEISATVAARQQV